MDMFNFLLEKNYLPKQTPIVSLRLAESRHTEILRTLATERGWTLKGEMFDAALEHGYPAMLSCLLELDCPHDDTYTLYHTVGEENIPWLVDNFPPTEGDLSEICANGPESVLLYLVKQGHLPESFKDDPQITLAALEEGFVDLVKEYLQAGYTFYPNVSLQVEDKASLEWLIEKEIGLCPALFYRLVNDAEEELVEKLVEVVDPPDDIQSLIYDKEIRGKGHTRGVAKIENIAEFIRDW